MQVRNRMLEEKYRDKLNLPIRIDKNYTFKVAETTEELESAFNLLHDSYVKANFMDAKDSRMRISLHYALPSTTIFIAKFKDRVVGTVSVIKDNPLGLPLEKAFSVDHLRKPGSAIAEVSALAIDGEFNHAMGEINLPLTKYMHEHCVKRLDVCCLVIAVNPKWETYYKAIWLFKKLQRKKIESYDFVKGAPACALFLKLRKLDQRMKRVYQGREASKDFHEFLFYRKFENFINPKIIESLKTEVSMKVDQLPYFFTQKTDLFHKVDDFEKNVITGNFKNINLQSFKKDLNRNDLRKHPRFSVRAKAFFFPFESKIRIADIIMVSRNGVQILSSYRFDVGIQVPMRIHLGENQCAILIIEAINKYKGLTGARIIFSDATWLEFIAHLEKTLVSDVEGVESA